MKIYKIGEGARLMNILLIEDNETLAKGLIYLLEQNKYKAIHTLNIKESINYLSKNRPDLIILDASLPDGNGFDLYDKEIKQRKINTIFLTAKDDEDDIVRGLELGAEDYITKPFSTRELIARINRIIFFNNVSGSKIMRFNCVFRRKYFKDGVCLFFAQ